MSRKPAAPPGEGVNVEPFRSELVIAREQQAATGEILHIISRMGPGSKAEPVLEAIVATAARLCGAEFALAHLLREDGRYHTVASNKADAALVKYAVEHPMLPSRGSLTGRTAFEGRTIHVEDCLADPDYAFPEFQQIGGFRSMLGVPLIRDGVVIGVLGLLRSVVAPFTEAQIALVTTFADQAVIALQNVSLFQAEQARTRELGEALQQQTATAELLKVISRSAFDLQTVLDTLVESATRLCAADHAWLFLREGDVFRWRSSFGHATDVHQRIKDYFKPLDLPMDRGSLTGRAALEARVVHVPDVLADPEYTWGGAQAIGGYRAALGVPLLRDGRVMGVIFVAKLIPQPYTEKQIELVATFADQAVIAIENVRLFEEVQARTRDVAETLESQTATSDVLGVISRSPSDIQPVLDAIAQTAAQLCKADFAFVYKLDAGAFQVAATNNAESDWVQYVRSSPVTPGRDTVVARVLLEKRTVHVEDVVVDREYTDHERQRLGKYRTVLGVPLLRDDVVIGAILLVNTAVQPFTAKQVALVETFADQAVIALNNVRLFDELQARTRELQARTDELTKLLEQQTAT